VERSNWEHDLPAAAGAGTRSMLVLDPPDHTRLRTLVTKAFTPRMVEDLRPRVEALVTEALDRAERQGGLELIEELASPLPVSVIATLVGVPPAEWRRFRELSRALMVDADPLVLLHAERVRGVVAARETLAAYLRGVIAERRRSPRPDLVSALIAVEEAGEALGEADLIVMLNLLLISGHETSSNLIGNGIMALLRHPEQLDRLRARPELIESAVEELLRWDSPVQLTARIARQDFELAGRQVRRGEMALALIGAANRDPACFPDPDRLDITRSPNPHLAFGRGIHSCLGAQLARMQGQVVIGALVQRFPRLRLAGQPERRRTVTLRGLSRLPLAVG
jgi:cytochrome P450